MMGWKLSKCVKKIWLIKLMTTAEITDSNNRGPRFLEKNYWACFDVERNSSLISYAHLIEINEEHRSHVEVQLSSMSHE